MVIPINLRTPMVVVQVAREKAYGTDELKIDRQTGKKVWRATVIVPDAERGRTEQLIVHITDNRDWSSLPPASSVMGLINGRAVLYGAGNRSVSLHADGFAVAKDGDGNE